MISEKFLNFRSYATIKKSLVKDFFISIFVIFVIYTIQKVTTPLILLPISSIFTLWFWKKRNTIAQLKLCILVLMTGSTIFEYFHSLILILLVLVQISDTHITKIKRLPLYIILFIGFGFFSYLFSQIVEFNPLSFPLYIVTFISCMAPFIYISVNKIKKNDYSSLLVFIIILAIMQAMIAYYDYVRIEGIIAILTWSSSPDDVVGTLVNANSFALLEYVAFFITISTFILKKQKIFYLFISLFFLLFALLADAKGYLIGFATGFAFFVFLFYLSKINLLHKILMLSISIILFLFAVNWVLVQIKPLKPFLELYSSGRYNHKAVYIERAFDPKNRNFFQYIFGTGPGTCGSRSSNSRTFDTMYKDEESVTLDFLPSFTSVYSRIFIVDLFQYDYAIEATHRSALLGNPFNSMTALFIEMGVIGFLLILLMHLFMITQAFFLFNQDNRIWIKSMSFIGFMLVVGCFIAGWLDQIYERPVPMYFMWIFIGMIMEIKEEKQKIDL